jgi:hypothetical protein
MMFHIGHEMAECLMRKPNSTRTKRQRLEGRPRPESGTESHLQRSRGTLDLLRSGSVASALLLALRRLF